MIQKKSSILPLLLLLLSLDHAAAQLLPWERLGKIDSAGVPSLAVSGPHEFYAGTQNGVFKSTDDGVSWSRLVQADVSCIQSSPLHHIYAGTNGGNILRSTDDGSSWQAVSVAPPSTYVYAFRAVSCIDSNIVLCSSDEGILSSIYRSADQGRTWTKVGSMSKRIAVAYAVGDSDVIFAGLSPNPFDNYSVMQSTDHGQTWTGLGLSGREMAASLIFVRGDLFCCSVSTILRSSDRGISWSTVMDGTGSALVANDLGHVFAASSAGVFRSTDRGMTWEAMVSGLDDLHVQSLAVDSKGVLYAATQSGLVFRTRHSTTDVPSANGLPHRFALSQNYPNPFNPTTAISYQLLAVSFVKLVVYDILGTEIANLVNDVRSAGTYTVQWDASSFPSGTYFYRLQAGNFVETKKMILLK